MVSLLHNSLFGRLSTAGGRGEWSRAAIQPKLYRYKELRGLTDRRDEGRHLRARSIMRHIAVVVLAAAAWLAISDRASAQAPLGQSIQFVPSKTYHLRS